MTFPKLLAAGLLSLVLTGCVSFTPSGPIGLPERIVEQSIPAGAMVKDVVISDPRLNENQRRNISNVLTTQIAQHVERGEYFERVISFPAKLGEQDIELQFEFSSLKGKRTPHPGYFPGALLTLTVWIWVNGPIYVDKYDLAAELTIRDATGKRSGRVAKDAATQPEHRALGRRLFQHFPGCAAADPAGRRPAARRHAPAATLTRTIE